MPPDAAHDRRLAITRLADSRPNREAVDRFVAEHSFPIVEGPSVTFVWRGDADAVNVRHWVFGLPSSQPLIRVPDTNLWFHIIEIPARSRVEYKLEIIRGHHRELIQDPLNPNRARDPFGANSVAHTAGYEVPQWTRTDPESRVGSIEEMVRDSKVFKERRRTLVYLPARFRRTRRYPLLIVHDGADYLRYAGMKTVLDNLIHRLEVPDVVVAFIDSPNRLREYANDGQHARYVTEELVPELERCYPLQARPQGRALMGASFGAVASFATAWRTPGFYGRLLLQSGSFAFSDIGRHNHRGPLFDPVVDFVNRYRDEPIAVAEKVFLSCGMYESLIYENRSLLPLLQETGMEVRYVEARDGHNWENWRDRLREGLSWLFPGPLLMVYE
ncbi:MAG: enterochelin esterase [Deltaproteobacteria bacterium]|nr:enterochelin esterase [Deltaproteobacteria bacterium]